LDYISARQKLVLTARAGNDMLVVVAACKGVDARDCYGCTRGILDWLSLKVRCIVL